jgi:hypothetical protein
MTENLILEKLENMEKKIGKIEGAVSLIAVQTERINNVSNQVNALWAKYDEAFGQNGVINEVRTFQASCPRQSIDAVVKRQWQVIGLLTTLVGGALFKAFGVI